jgi:hypothetical protein
MRRETFETIEGIFVKIFRFKFFFTKIYNLKPVFFSTLGNLKFSKRPEGVEIGCIILRRYIFI